MADSIKFKISGTGEGVCSVDKDHAALLTFTDDLAMYSHVYLELPAELSPKSAILTSNTPVGAEVDPEIVAYYMFNV